MSRSPDKIALICETFCRPTAGPENLSVGKVDNPNPSKLISIRSPKPPISFFPRAATRHLRQNACLIACVFAFSLSLSSQISVWLPPLTITPPLARLLVQIALLSMVNHRVLMPAKRERQEAEIPRSTMVLAARKLESPNPKSLPNIISSESKFLKSTRGPRCAASSLFFVYNGAKMYASRIVLSSTDISSMELVDPILPLPSRHLPLLLPSNGAMSPAICPNSRIISVYRHPHMLGLPKW